MRKQLLLLALLGTGTIQTHAQATGLLTGKTYIGETTYDKIWSLFNLYKDESNPILQEFSLQGRLQAQYANGDSNRGHFDIEDYRNKGNKDSVWGDHIEGRRAQLGFKSKWFQNWKLDGQIDAYTEFEDPSGDNAFYKDIYDLFLTYAPSDALNIALGKKEVAFGREYEISSKEILTFERSMVTNALFSGNLTGIWASGKGIADHWLYEVGVYGADRQKEFSTLNEGAVFLGKIGYDYSEQTGLDTAVTSFQYMHNSNPGFTGDNGSSPKFTDSIGLTNDITQGRFGLTTDILYGVGDESLGQSDLFGLTIIPSYFIADGLQVVSRLQLASSSGANGLSLPGRYEKVSQTKDAKGNSYVSAYLGVNYYLYGHKLKVMNGIEYSHLGAGDYDGYTFLSGLRFSF